MPLNVISYKKAIWKGIEGHLKGIVQNLEDSRQTELYLISNIIHNVPVHSSTVELSGKV